MHDYVLPGGAKCAFSASGFVLARTIRLILYQYFGLDDVDLLRYIADQCRSHVVTTVGHIRVSWLSIMTCVSRLATLFASLGQLVKLRTITHSDIGSQDVWLPIQA